MLGGNRDVVGCYAGSVEGLHSKHVAIGVGVGEDAGVGDAQALQVVGQEVRCRVLERQIQVDRVQAPAVEEMVALRCYCGLQIGSWLMGGDQRQVVILVHLHVQAGSLGHPCSGRRVGERAAQFAQCERLADDLAVARRGVDSALVAVVELGVEEGGRLTARAPVGSRVVGDGGWDPAEQETGLVGPQIQVRALAG